jgi:hypothetical protein
MIVKTFVNKCLSLSRLSEKWCNLLIQNLVEAGRTISYVETTTPTQADTLHLAIKGSDKRTFMHEFEQVVRFAIAKLKLKNKKVKVAFDTTEDLTWCKKKLFLRPSVYEKPQSSWQYLNLSIVEPFFIPLMSIPYTLFDNLDNLVIDLVYFVESLPLKIDLMLFDRGFYHAHLIDFLNSRNHHYLMLVPERDIQKKYIEQTREQKKSFDYFNHFFNYHKDKSSWNMSTLIMVRIIDEKTAWCYATNKKPSLGLTLEYRKRWNIETGFRVHDEARIKSKSNFLLIRYFYHLIGMLLILLWRLKNKNEYLVFKRFLKKLELVYAKMEIHTKPPPPL